MSTKKATVQRLGKLMGFFAMEYLSCLEEIEEEKKVCAEAEKTGMVRVYDTGKWQTCRTQKDAGAVQPAWNGDRAD